MYLLGVTRLAGAELMLDNAKQEGRSLEVQAIDACNRVLCFGIQYCRRSISAVQAPSLLTIGVTGGGYLWGQASHRLYFLAFCYLYARRAYYPRTADGLNLKSFYSVLPLTDPLCL